MDSDVTFGRYRPVCKYLRIGDREYAVLDPEIAQQRAIDHFSEALALLEQASNPQQQHQINQSLILATDFGSKDAPYLLALRIMDETVEVPFTLRDVVVLLKLAAERGHPEAALQLGTCYAAMNQFPQIEQAAQDYFAEFSELERIQLAEYYLQRAIDTDYQLAIEEVIIAYAYGRGYIQPDAAKFMALCENQVAKNNQSVTLGYAAWLAGMTVEGGDPLSDAIVVPQDPKRALDYLFRASRGSHLQLARHALHLICCGVERGVWTETEKLRRYLHKNAKAGNQLLSLYLAWYAIPEDHRAHLPPVFKDFELPGLARFVTQDQQQALTYLDSAFFGADEDISEVAKEILSQVFGRCFMDGDGMLVWETTE